MLRKISSILVQTLRCIKITFLRCSSTIFTYHSTMTSDYVKKGDLCLPYPQELQHLLQESRIKVLALVALRLSQDFEVARKSWLPNHPPWLMSLDYWWCIPPATWWTSPWQSGYINFLSCIPWRVLWYLWQCCWMVSWLYIVDSNMSSQMSLMEFCKYFLHLAVGWTEGLSWFFCWLTLCVIPALHLSLLRSSIRPSSFYRWDFLIFHLSPL